MPHAFLAPSAAHIWAPPNGCRAYPLMAQLYPQEDSDESREGDACHEIAADDIRAVLRGMKPRSHVGQIASNGVVLSEELHEAVQVYVDDVLRQATGRAVFGGSNLGIESHLDPSPDIHPDNAGTPDLWLYDAGRHTLVVYDAKFGHGIVEAEENWQALNYAALLLHRVFKGQVGEWDQTLTVEIRIVQPRAFHRDGPVRKWTLTGADLRAYVNDFYAAAHEAAGDDPTARSGTHCRYCPGRHACGTAQRAAMASVDYATTMLPEDLPPEAVALEVRTLRRAYEAIKYRLTGMEEQAEAQAKQGVKFPGLGLTPTYGREKWTVTPEEVYGLGEMYGVDLRQDKPITPRQAEKLGIDDAVIKAYSEIPKTGLKLVEQDDTLAARVFKPTQQE